VGEAEAEGDVVVHLVHELLLLELVLLVVLVVDLVVALGLLLEGGHLGGCALHEEVGCCAVFSQVEVAEPAQCVHLGQLEDPAERVTALGLQFLHVTQLLQGQLQLCRLKGVLVRRRLCRLDIV